MLLFQNFIEIFDQFDESLLDEQALIDVLTDGNNSAIDDYFYDLFGKICRKNSHKIKYFLTDNIENDQTLTDEIASILTTLQPTIATTETFQAVATSSTASPSTPSTLTTITSAILSPDSAQLLQGTLATSSTTGGTTTGNTTSGITTSGITTSSFDNSTSSDFSTSGTRNDIVASILLILSSFLLRI